MTDVTINIPARTLHLCPVMTGFILLKNQGKLSLKINTAVSLPSASIMEAIVDGKRLAYDMADGYNFHNLAEIEEYIKTCDFYFKRSFSDNQNRSLFREQADKIYLWGFNYLVTCDGNDCFNHNPEKRLIEIVNFFRGRKPLRYFTYDRFEAVPNKKDEQNILFMTRLWSDKQTTSKNICPELILPDKITKRDSYLETMKASDICIGSTGLHGSIGWKTGEYIAASRAIINEAFCYEVTGDFEIGKNYLAFQSVDECITHVDKLFNDSNMVYEMKQNNRNYYLNYLRPDIQVANSLKEAGITI